MTPRSPMKNLPNGFKVLIPTLESTGLPWDVEPGGKHFKIKVAGKLAGIFPHNGNRGGRDGASSRVIQNLKSQIRRVAHQHG